MFILPRLQSEKPCRPKIEFGGSIELRESVTLDWSPFLPSNALNSNRQD